jgi:hypothetical protein
MGASVHSRAWPNSCASWIALQYSMFVARGDVSRSMTHHLERMPHAATLAKLFDAPCLDLPPSFIRPGSNPDDHERWCCGAGCALAKVREAANVILLYENEEEIYGDIPHRLPRYRHLSGLAESEAGVDPVSFVQVGV